MPSRIEIGRFLNPRPESKGKKEVRLEESSSRSSVLEEIMKEKEMWIKHISFLLYQGNSLPFGSEFIFSTFLRACRVLPYTVKSRPSRDFLLRQGLARVWAVPIFDWWVLPFAFAVRRRFFGLAVAKIVKIVKFRRVPRVKNLLFENFT